MLSYGSRVREIKGGVPATTNNRMELMAAIEALRALKVPCEVEFYTDSEYLRNGVMAWMPVWKRNGWRTKAKKPVKNEDLWRMLDAVAPQHAITWKWLKGHAGHAGNERCDELANEAIAEIKRTFTRDQLKASLVTFSAGEVNLSSPDLL